MFICKRQHGRQEDYTRGAGALEAMADSFHFMKRGLAQGVEMSKVVGSTENLLQFPKDILLPVHFFLEDRHGAGRGGRQFRHLESVRIKVVKDDIQCC